MDFRSEWVGCTCGTVFHLLCSTRERPVERVHIFRGAVEMKLCTWHHMISNSVFGITFPISCDSRQKEQ